MVLDAGCGEGDIDKVGPVVAELLRRIPGPVIVLNRHLRLAEMAGVRPEIHLLAVPKLDMSAQRALWSKYLKGAKMSLENGAIEALTERFESVKSSLDGINRSIGELGLGQIAVDK